MLIKSFIDIEMLLEEMFPSASGLSVKPRGFSFMESQPRKMVFCVIKKWRICQCLCAGKPKKYNY